MGEKMGFDRPMSIKLNSAEELFQLFMNKDKLKGKILHLMKFP